MDRIDPLSDKFPSQSPYVTSGNSPIMMVDVEGREMDHAIYWNTMSNLDGDPNLSDAEIRISNEGFVAAVVTTAVLCGAYYGGPAIIKSAASGAAVGGGMDIGSQLFEGNSFAELDWARVGGKAARASIGGGSVGLFGKSVNMGTHLFAGSGSEVLGGVIDRYITGEDILAPDALGKDAIAGGAGGLFSGILFTKSDVTKKIVGRVAGSKVSNTIIKKGVESAPKVGRIIGKTLAKKTTNNVTPDEGTSNSNDTYKTNKYGGNGVGLIEP